MLTGSMQGKDRAISGLLDELLDSPRYGTAMGSSTPNLPGISQFSLCGVLSYSPGASGAFVVVSPFLTLPFTSIPYSKKSEVGRDLRRKKKKENNSKEIC